MGSIEEHEHAHEGHS